MPEIERLPSTYTIKDKKHDTIKYELRREET